jgi:hypothetical protein
MVEKKVPNIIAHDFSNFLIGEASKLEGLCDHRHAAGIDMGSHATIEIRSQGHMTYSSCSSKDVDNPLNLVNTLFYSYGQKTRPTFLSFIIPS